MNPLDESIVRAYFRMEEAQRQRLWMQRQIHPETFTWAKKGNPPPMTAVKKIRLEEVSKLGFNETYYQDMLRGEGNAKVELEEFAELHPLWTHFQRLSGFGKYLCGAFIAASGDISEAPTVTAFWKRMGLDVLPDGTVPRRVRGSSIGRSIPALPHVTKIGEQIRQAIIRSSGNLRHLYEHYREVYDAKYPDRAKMFNYKAAIRVTQKILYSCAWREWRIAYGLPAPLPYAFDILKHDSSTMITMASLWDRESAPGKRKPGKREPRKEEVCHQQRS